MTEVQLQRAEKITPIVSVQNRYNVVDRASESMVDLCEQEELAFLPWAPIQEADEVDVITYAARNHGYTPRQIVLAWLLARSPQILPIPGSGSPEHVEANIAAASIKLDQNEVAAITDASLNIRTAGSRSRTALIPEMAVVLDQDRRSTGRRPRLHGPYLQLPNYVSNLRRFGYGTEDTDGAGSERLIDAIIPHGPSVIAERARQHLQAGADHVLLQPLGADGGFAFADLAPLAEAPWPPLTG